MGLAAWFRRMRGARERDAAVTVSPRPRDDDRQGRARRWLEAFEAGLLNPPQDVHDAAAWDTYWRNQLEYGGDSGMADMMASTPGFPEWLRRRGARTVLCAGNGLSFESLSLALFGFEVSSLDIAPWCAETMLHSFAGPNHFVRAIPGCRLREDGVLAFETEGPLDLAGFQPVHSDDAAAALGGGSLAVATGDLVDPAICPGPFDVVIERRTVQLFPAADRSRAFERLAARLSPHGVLVSQQHLGGWRPGQSRTHFGERWLRSHGFVITEPDDGAPLTGRIAWLMTTSG